METETVTSWRELDDAIAAADRPAGRGRAHSRLVFRGLARSDFSNVSSLARLEGEYVSLERHLLRNFRKYAHREAPGPTVWDWLSLASHHGLPTRLLDWTYSPLVALHFATAAWSDDDAVLLAVDVERVHERLPAPLREVLDREGAVVFTTELLAECAASLEALDELAEDDPFLVFFEPPSLDERIVNQAAVLSTFADASRQLDDWLEENPGSSRGWRLGPDVKAEIRERLDQANVTERVLLPGLDGLASWLRRHYSPGRAGRAAGGTMASSAAEPGYGEPG
jgi:hypothetical protein